MISKLNKPLLMIQSDGCVLPDYTKKYFEAVPSEDKELFWVETEKPSPMHQFDFYDQKEEVDLSVDKTSAFFHEALK